MKFLTFLLAIAFLAAAEALTDEQKAKIREYHTACVAESQVDPEIPKKVETSGIYEDDPKFKEYLFCFNKKAGFQNENGDFQTNVWKAKLGTTLSQEEINHLITKCIVKKDTPQNTAFETFKCIKKSSSKKLI